MCRIAPVTIAWVAIGRLWSSAAAMATESKGTSKMQSLCSVSFEAKRILGGCAHFVYSKDKGNIFAWLALTQSRNML